MDSEDVMLSWWEVALLEPAAQRTAELDDEKPPFFSTWSRLYAAIVAYLAFLILLFYLFTRAYHLPQ